MYTVAQSATGSVGMWSLLEIIRHPDLEFVALRVYNPDKVGQDTGCTAGGDAVGVCATDRIDDIVASGADVVMHCSQAFGQLGQMADDVVTLLRAGLNVVTVSDYIAPGLQSEELLTQLDSAAKAGAVTLHGTGIDPGFLCDRLPATLTGLSTEIDHIEMREIADLRGHPNPSMIMDLLGFGLKPDEFQIDPTNPGLQYCATMFPQAVYTLFETP